MTGMTGNVDIRRKVLLVIGLLTLHLWQIDGYNT